MSDKDTAVPTEDDDLSKFDDGSVIEGAEDDDADDADVGDKGSKGKGTKEKTDRADKDADDKRERDENGRFKPAKGDDDADAGDKGKGKKAGGEKDADADEEEEPEEDDADDADDEEEEEDDGKGKAAGRIRTLVEQRNKARDQAEELTARVLALEKQHSKEEKKEEDVTKTLKTELEKLYEDVEELRADNKTKDAAKAQRRIDEIKEEISDIKTQATSRRESFAVAENREFDRMLDLLEEVRPVIKKGSEEFDPEVVKELDFQVKAYEKMGMPSTKALRRACALIFVEDPFAPVKKTTAKEEKDDKKETAKKTDIKKNLDAAKKTPPKPERSESGEKDKKLDVGKMTLEEFEALPESKKKELGGDFLE